MVEALLTAEPSAAGTSRIPSDPVDLGPVLAGAVTLHRVTAKNRDIEVDDSGLPSAFTAQVDPDTVVRMLDNVLGNALKFTPRGGLVRVWLKQRNGLGRGLPGRLAGHWDLTLDTFDLIVEDNGPGLSPEVQERLFEPKNRGPASGADQVPGTGLGLAVTRHLAESLGGQVRLISLTGQGTTVWLRLPRDPAAAHFLRACVRLEEALAQETGNGVRPLVGLLDLRPAAGQTPAPDDGLRGFIGQESSGYARVWEPAAGLWATPVLDPVNWNRRWMLYAARRGEGLEGTRWEYLPAPAAEESAIWRPARKQRETMVNSAPLGSNKG
jgi:hypothetical protein